MTPVILHLDMNSYFATVEQQDHLEWRGKVLGVCEHLGGIIIAASVEAKKWGIKTGTPVWEAKKVYPKIILTKTRAEAYRKYNRLIVQLVSDYTDKVEVASIDEVVLDITKVCNIKKGTEDFFVNPFAEAVKIALEIKQRITKEVGDYLTCSIGIAENKLLAKIASDIHKPDGLVVVDKEPTVGCVLEDERVIIVTKQILYQKLKLTDVPGIGRRQEKNLNELGIKTLLDLKNCKKDLLVARFGVVGGYHLYNMGQLNSSWKPIVKQDDKMKSIGHMYTLPKQYRQSKFFMPVLYKLCEMVGARLRKKKLSGNIIHFFILDKDYKSFGESRHLGNFINDGRDIFLQCMKIYEKLKVRDVELKLIGVTMAGLEISVCQQSLFKEEFKKDSLVKALDVINTKYGEATVCRAQILGVEKVFRDSVGFGRVKEM